MGARLTHSYPVGTTTIIWTATDSAGNFSTQTQSVIVTDVEVPVVRCRDITIELNGTGSAKIAADQIDNGSTDNCGIASFTLDQTLFTTADAGFARPVKLTVTDIHGNTAFCVATVTVKAPVALSITDARLLKGTMGLPAPFNGLALGLPVLKPRKFSGPPPTAPPPHPLTTLPRTAH